MKFFRSQSNSSPLLQEGSGERRHRGCQRENPQPSSTQRRMTWKVSLPCPFDLSGKWAHSRSVVLIDLQILTGVPGRLLSQMQVKRQMFLLFLSFFLRCRTCHEKGKTCSAVLKIQFSDGFTELLAPNFHA